MTWMQDQLRQPSTWRGVFLLIASGLGITLSEEVQGALLNLAVAGLGLWEALRKGGQFGGKAD